MKRLKMRLFQCPFRDTVCGFNSYLTNISLIKRSGIELVLDAKVMTKKDFTWDVTDDFL